MILIAGALVVGVSAAISAIRGRVRSAESESDDFPAHALFAITGAKVYAFEARQRHAWLRGGWSGWGPSGWMLGREIGCWARSVLVVTAKKDLISWKLSLTPPSADPYSLEAQAYGARGSNEAVIGLLTQGSAEALPAPAN